MSKKERQHREGGDFGERIDEGGAESRKHIQVGASGRDEGEKRRAVDAFAQGEDCFEIFEIVDYEIEGFEPAVAGGIHEVDHLYVVFRDIADDVVLGEVGLRLAKGLYNEIL